MAVTLIANTTSATQSASVRVPDGVRCVVQLMGTWGGSEYADIQYYAGGTAADLYEDGSQVRLSSTNKAKAILGPFVFRVDKDATASSAGVEIEYSPGAAVVIR